MRYSHCPSGIIGITLKAEALKTWALGLHICFCLEQDIVAIVGGSFDYTQDTHKEETKARIASDRIDRESIRNKLDIYIDPLAPATHPTNVLNIVTGQVADSTVQDAVAIGTKSMKEFEKGWPEGLNSTISKNVKTMEDSKKHTQVFDTSVIYNKVIGIQANSREINIKNVIISHEVSTKSMTRGSI